MPARLTRATVIAAAALGLAIPGAPGAALLYAALGFLPGAACMRFLPLGQGGLAQLAFALALSPLVTTIVAWAFVSAGGSLRMAATAIAVAAGMVWFIGGLGPRTTRATGAKPGIAPVLIAIAGVALVAGVFFGNPVIQLHSDGWIHAGIVGEIMARGIPPEDPRFAGLPLNYVWFYNFFIALQSTLGDDDPFHVMALFNACNLGATLLVAWVAGHGLWGHPAGTGAALLTGLGFSAGSWMLWPLHLLRAIIGENRGWHSVAESLNTMHLDDYRVIWTISAPYAYMANFLDKFLVGTALNYAYLMLSVYLAAMVLWFGAGARAGLILAGAGACGMLLFHGVVGISAIPVAVGALALAAVLSLKWKGLPTLRSLAGFALATGIGALAAAPYTWSIARGWAAETSELQHSYFGFDAHVVWTLVVGIAAAAWLAARPLKSAIRQRRGAVILLACFAVGMALFASAVKLTLGNHIKFVYQTFLPIALIGAAGWWPAWNGLRRRFGIAGAGLVFGAVFLVGPTLTVRGYLLDDRGQTTHAMHLTDAEAALYAWIRASTPADAVFVDAEMRDYIMVLGGRQLWLGTRFGPELAAFPASQVHARRAIMRDLYQDQRDLDRDRAALTALGRPAYVLFRQSDFEDDRTPWTSLGPDAGFHRVYDSGGFVVYHLTPPRTSTDPEADP